MDEIEAQDAAEISTEFAAAAQEWSRPFVPLALPPPLPQPDQSAMEVDPPPPDRAGGAEGDAGAAADDAGAAADNDESVVISSADALRFMREIAASTFQTTRMCSCASYVSMHGQVTYKHMRHSSRKLICILDLNLCKKTSIKWIVLHWLTVIYFDVACESGICYQSLVAILNCPSMLWHMTVMYHCFHVHTGMYLGHWYINV